MANLPLPLKMLLRDWRAGELRVLALALVIAVASVTSVAFFADRVWQALTREARSVSLLRGARAPHPLCLFGREIGHSRASGRTRRRRRSRQQVRATGAL